MNTKFIFNKSVMNKLGITENDLEKISKEFPEKVKRQTNNSILIHFTYNLY